MKLRTQFYFSFIINFIQVLYRFLNHSGQTGFIKIATQDVYERGINLAKCVNTSNIKSFMNRENRRLCVSLQLEIHIAFQLSSFI